MKSQITADLSNCKSLSVAFNEKESSLSEALAKDAMEPNYNKETKKQRTKRTFCTLEASEELNMLEFIRENPIIWNIKLYDYRRTDKKNKLWEDQAKVMGQNVDYIQGWFRSLRDTHTRLSKKRSGDGAPEFTQREAWILESFAFLKKVVRHRSEPINSLKNANVEDILDKENQSVHAKDEKVDTVDPEKTSSDSSGRNSKRIKCNDHVLQTLQENLVESGKIIQDLSKPQPVTSVTTFANYVRDSLVTMSMKKFKRARSSINVTLTKLMDEDSDDPEQPLLNSNLANS